MSRELKMTKEEFWHLIDEMRAACGTDMAKEEHGIGTDHRVPMHFSELL